MSDDPADLVRALIAEVERLTALVLEYGRHKILCTGGRDGNCDCGFTEVRRALEEGK